MGTSASEATGAAGHAADAPGPGGSDERSGVAEVATPRRRLIYHRYYDSCALQQFLQDPDAFIDAADATVLKSDATSTVACISFDGRKYVAKRYNTRGLWHVCKRAFRRTRAEHSWCAALQLARAGIDTPRPVAVVERRLGPLRGRAYYLTEHVDGELCSTYLRRQCPQRDAIVDVVATTFARLQRHRLSHGDMKATNLIVSDGRLYLLDLDAARAHRTAAGHARALMRDKRRFLANWDDVAELRNGFERALGAMAL